MNAMEPQFGLVLVLLFSSLAAADGTLTQPVTTKITALTAYEKGFAFDVIRSAGNGSVQLDDLVLIENDAPGAGFSQKGTCCERIHQGVLARKTLFLQNPAARDAHVVLFMKPLLDRDRQEPYYLLLNGHRIAGSPIAWHEGTWHWVRVPVGCLRQGKNEIIVGCDAAEGQGYELLLAREDEYQAGGGKHTYEGNTAMIAAGQVKLPANPEAGTFQEIEVGEYSARSTDGGRTWKKRKLGHTNDVVGEYTIRLNLDRYKPRGRLQSAPIDLWAGLPGYEKIVPRSLVEDLCCHVSGQTPPETEINWYVRFADTPDARSGQWKEFKLLGSGRETTFHLDNDGKRYLQWQAELKTADPLRTPVVQGVRIHRRLRYHPPPADTFYVSRYENVEHRYSSYEFAYQDCQHPKLRALRRRLRLDEVLKGTRGDFEKINRLRHYVSGLWFHDLPHIDYPEWDADEILDRNKRLGAGGMCIQFSIVFFQCLQSLGYHARHVNIFAHETIEVYVDELGKWVHVDPESLFDSYQFNTQSGEPINVLQQHRYFLRSLGFSAERPIDWMATKAWAWPSEDVDTKPQPLGFSTFTDWINDPANPPPQYRLAGFLRLIPRNDYFSRPHPRPVNKGLQHHWPWNGYLNWYDQATPRKLQYALHSDREADFYPTLNRVQFSALFGKRAGELEIEMITFAPNFDGFEINVDGTGWRRSPQRFSWSLRPSAVNTLEMRARNKLGPLGKPSLIKVLWHYREPFKAREGGRPKY